MACRAKWSVPSIETSTSPAHSTSSATHFPSHASNHSRFHLHKAGGSSRPFATHGYLSNPCNNFHSGQAKSFRFFCNASPLPARSVEGIASPIHLEADGSPKKENVFCFFERESPSSRDRLLESCDNALYANESHAHSNSLHSSSISQVSSTAANSDYILESLNGKEDIFLSDEPEIQLGIPSFGDMATSAAGNSSTNHKSSTNIESFSIFSPSDESLALESPCSTSSPSDPLELEVSRSEFEGKTWIDIFSEFVHRARNGSRCDTFKPESIRSEQGPDLSSNRATRRLDLSNPLFSFSVFNEPVSSESRLEEKFAIANDDRKRLGISDLEERIKYEMGQKNGNVKECIVRAIVYCIRELKTAREIENVLHGSNFFLPVFSSVLHKLGRENNIEASVSLFHWLFLRSKGLSCPPLHENSNLLNSAEFGLIASDSKLNGGFNSVNFENDESGNDLQTLNASSKQRDVRLNVFLYNSFLGCLKTMHKLELMSEVIEIMEEEGIAPDVVTFNTLLSVMVNEDQAPPAFALFDSMKQMSVAPDLLTYGTLIQLCKKKGLAESALALYEEMAVSDLPTEHPKKIQRAEIEAEVRKICLSQMSQLSKTMQDQHQSDAILILFWRTHSSGIAPCKAAFQFAISACCRFPDRHLSNLRPLYFVMRRSGFTPKVDLCNDVIRALGKVKRWWSALEIFEKMKEDGPPPNAATHRELNYQFRILLNAAKKRRLWKWSLLLIDRMASVGLKTDFYCWKVVLATCAAAKQTEASVNVFQRMMSLGFKPDGFAYGCLLSALERGGLTERVEEVWLHMKRLGISCNAEAYTTLISSYGNKGDYDKAKNAFESMCGDGIEPDVISYNSIITACVLSEKGDESLVWLSKMKEAGVTPNQVSYQQVIHALLQQERVHDALRVYKELKQQGLTPTPKTQEMLRHVSSDHGVPFDSHPHPLPHHANPRLRKQILSPP